MYYHWLGRDFQERELTKEYTSKGMNIRFHPDLTVSSGTQIRIEYLSTDKEVVVKGVFLLEVLNRV